MNLATAADTFLMCGCLAIAAVIWVKEDRSLKELLIYLSIAILTASAFSNVYHH